MNIGGLCTIESEVSVSITPRQMAKIYWETMGHEEQREFFDELGWIYNQQAGDFCVQLAWVTGEGLSTNARNVLKLFGEYADAPVQTSL